MTSPNRLSSLKKETWSSDFSKGVLPLRSRCPARPPFFLFLERLSIGSEERYGSARSLDGYRGCSTPSLSTGGIALNRKRRSKSCIYSMLCLALRILWSVPPYHQVLKPRYYRKPLPALKKTNAEALIFQACPPGTSKREGDFAATWPTAVAC